MSDRFSRFFTCQSDLGVEDSPVLIKAGALLIDNQSQKIIAQFRLQNISEKKISLVKIKVTPQDSIQRDLEGVTIYEYLDLKCNFQEEFGSKKAIFIPNPSTRAMNVGVVEVAFEDGTVWTNDVDAWQPLDSESPNLKRFDAKLKHQEALELKIKNTEISLAKAISLFESIAEFEDVEELIAECQNRITALREKAKFEQEEAERKAKKNKKIATIASISTFGAIAILLLFFLLIIPSIQYNKAMKLISQGDDTSAVTILYKIRNFKDSESLINDIHQTALEKAEEAYLAGDCAGAVDILSSVNYLGEKLDMYQTILNGNYLNAIQNYELSEIVLPNDITRIDDFAFEDCTSLTSLIIPDSVTSIGKSAFSGCTFLASVTLPEGLTEIGESAFRDCTNLYSLNIPSSVTSIGGNTFNGCNNLTSVTLPDGITEIAAGTFMGCRDLSSISIPASITEIGSSAFEGCNSLTSITIPNSVTRIGSSTFKGCNSLTSITIPNGVTQIGSSAFEECNSLTSITLPFIGEQKDATSYSDTHFGYLFGAYSSEAQGTKIPESLKTVVITGNITYIDDSAFESCSNLTSITLPNSIKIIGKKAFRSCSNLASINIPNNVTTIDDYAFAHCSNLSGITIPNSVTYLGEYAFAFCSNLLGITLPNSVTYLGEYVFASCSSLSAITLPNGIESIPAYAFQGCSKLSGITLPNRVSYIGKSAFSSCTGLSKITIPLSVTTIKAGAFTDCENLTIFCETSSYPSGWERPSYSSPSSWNHWNPSERPVIWGSTGEEYTYTFITNGGNWINDIVSDLKITLPTPEQAGMVFVGWYDNAELSGEPLTSPYYSTTNHTLYAKWMTELEYAADGKSIETAYFMYVGEEKTGTIRDSSQTIYYRFTPTETKSYTISAEDTSNSHWSSYYSDYVEVRLYDDPTQDWLVSQRQNSVSITYTLTAGETYYISVAGFEYYRYSYSDDPYATGDFTILISESE